MSSKTGKTYLDESVTEITTGAEKAAFLHIEETDRVELSTSLDAEEYAKRFYRITQQYPGPLHAVSEESPDGFRVMVMEDHSQNEYFNKIEACEAGELKLKDDDGVIFWVDSYDSNGAYIHTDEGDSHRTTHSDIRNNFEFVEA